MNNNTSLAESPSSKKIAIVTDCSTDIKIESETGEVKFEKEYELLFPKENNYKKIPPEIRRKMIKELDDGKMSLKEASVFYDFSYSTISRIYKDYRLHGKKVPLQRGGHKKKILETENLHYINNLIADDCKITLKQIQKKLSIECDLEISISTLHNYIEGFHFSIKRLDLVTEISTSTELTLKRQHFAEGILNAVTDKPVIFFDESQFQILMRKFYGKAERGKKILSLVPQLRYRNRNILVAMSKEGLLFYSVQDSSANEPLSHYVTILCNVLKDQNHKNAIIVMDDSSVQKCKEIEKIIQQRGHQLQRLPSSSPFLNPIGIMFSRWASIVRSKNPGTEAQLMDTVNKFQGIVTAEQCQGYYKQAIENMENCVNDA